MDQPYDNQDSPPLTEEEVSKAVFMGARQGRSGCHDYVDLEDLIQVCWVDYFDKSLKYARYITEGNFNGLVKEFTRTAAVFAQREKALTLGYRPEDLFFYSKRALRRVIPLILESWASGDLYEFEYPDRAMWVDVDKSLKELSSAELQIIRWAFEGDNDTVADRLSISEGAASVRVSRLLDKLRRSLGGEDPTPRRKSFSNAASQAVTRNQWDGNA